MKNVVPRKLDHLRSQISFKISIINSLFFFLAFAVILVIMSFLNYKIISRKDEQIYNAYLTNSILSVDNKLRDMSRVSLMSTTGDKVQKILPSYQKESINNKNQDEEYLKEYYTSLIEIRDDISGIYMCDNTSLIFHYDIANPSFRRDVDPYQVLEKLRRKAEDLRESNSYLTVDELPEFMRYRYRSDAIAQNCVWLLRDIYSFSPNRKIGFVALTMPLHKIKDLLEENLGSDMFYILMTKSGNIICCQDQAYIRKNIKGLSPSIYKALGSKDRSEVKWNGEVCKIAIQNSEYSDLILVTGKSVKHFAEEATSFIWFSIAIGLFVAMFIVVLTFRNVGTILKPLKLLAYEMSHFNEKSLKVQYPVTGKDEIGQLVKAFNTMVNMLDQLIETQYIDKVRIKEIQLNEQKLSMLYMKSQVNPHFLYNTLDTIRIRAEINNDRDVSYMLMELVKFFRLNVKMTNQFVTLEHEFSLIDAYLKLMCYRYEKISYEYDIDKTLMDVSVPNFILQPIVENSLLHGLRDKGYRGSIYLSVHKRELDGRIEILIMDTGVGFSTATREQVNAVLKDFENSKDTPKEQNSIGILNVQKRLKMFYNEECGLYYTDNEEGGVTAHIIIEDSCEDKASY